MQTDIIHNIDCLEGLKELPDKCIDLMILDPPYDMEKTGGGAFGTKNRTYYYELHRMADGITNGLLDEVIRVMKRPNIYIWCNKKQIRQYIDYFEDAGCTTDIPTWHKTNPTPAHNNKYLSDTEYLLFFRDKGVKVYGSYDTKRKWYVTPTNKADKIKWKHPTIKPLFIIRNIIINSSKEGDIVCDPFMGSGTTAVAAIQTLRQYICYEVEAEWCEIAKERIAVECADYRRCEQRVLSDFKEVQQWSL